MFILPIGLQSGMNRRHVGQPHVVPGRDARQQRGHVVQHQLDYAGLVPRPQTCTEDRNVSRKREADGATLTVGAVERRHGHVVSYRPRYGILGAPVLRRHEICRTQTYKNTPSNIRTQTRHKLQTNKKEGRGRSQDVMFESGLVFRAVTDLG